MEMGGYFICNGIERIIRLLIIPKRNIVLGIKRNTFRNRGPSHSDYAVTIRCVRQDQSSVTMRLYYLNHGSADLGFSLRKQEFLIPVGIILKNKKSVQNKNMRKRAMEDSAAEGSNSGAAVVRSSRVSRKNEGKLEFSSGATVSRTKQSEDEADEKKVGNSFFYESSRVTQTDIDQRATATNETETAFDRDAWAIREKVLNGL